MHLHHRQIPTFNCYIMDNLRVLTVPQLEAKLCLKVLLYLILLSSASAEVLKTCDPLISSHSPHLRLMSSCSFSTYSVHN